MKKKYILTGALIGFVIGIIILLAPWLLLSLDCLKLVCPFQLFNVGGANCTSDCHPDEIKFFLPFILIIITVVLLTLSLLGAIIAWILYKRKGKSTSNNSSPSTPSTH